jgi:hypothetical protein
VVGASGKRVGGIAAALAAAVVLGAGIGFAAKRAAACHASEGSTLAAPGYLIASPWTLPSLVADAARTRLSCAAEGRVGAAKSVDAGAKLGRAAVTGPNGPSWRP